MFECFVPNISELTLYFNSNNFTFPFREKQQVNEYFLFVRKKPSLIMTCKGNTLLCLLFTFKLQHFAATTLLQHHNLTLLPLLFYTTTLLYITSLPLHYILLLLLLFHYYYYYYYYTTIHYYYAVYYVATNALLYHYNTITLHFSSSIFKITV